MKLFSDTIVLFVRLMKYILRNIDAVLSVIFTPIMMMILFVYVFGGALKTGDVNYVNYILPGILLMAISSGVIYTTVRVFNDVHKGMFARFNSMPIHRSSVLMAQVLTSIVSNMISVVVVILIAFVMGFRPSAGILEWLAAAGILIYFTLALTWVAVIPGLTAKTSEGSTVFAYPLTFLPFISSAFISTETMPKAVRMFAENQPVTSIVETVRALLNSEPVGNDIWVALAWCTGIMIVAWFFAVRAFKRKIV